MMLFVIIMRGTGTGDYSPKNVQQFSALLPKHGGTAEGTALALDGMSGIMLPMIPIFIQVTCLRLNKFSGHTVRSVSIYALDR